MQYMVVETPFLGEMVEAESQAEAVRIYAKKFPRAHYSIRRIAANGVEYKVTITRGVVDGVDEVQA